MKHNLKNILSHDLCRATQFEARYKVLNVENRAAVDVYVWPCMSQCLSYTSARHVQDPNREIQHNMSHMMYAIEILIKTSQTTPYVLLSSMM
jgi:hypothetical protein